MINTITEFVLRIAYRVSREENRNQKTVSSIQYIVKKRKIDQELKFRSSSVYYTPSKIIIKS